MTAAGSGFGAARGMNPVGWLGLPAFAAILATIVFATPIRIVGFGIPQPVFPLALAFAWALIRPSVLPPFALLVLGLFLDVFWGGPQGLWPLCLLTTYASVLTVRRLLTGHEFVVVWAWYALATAIAFGVGFLLMYMASGVAPNLVALAWQYGATLILYPFAHRLIERYEDADVRFR
jgi:rod shape-determining protein MreD